MDADPKSPQQEGRSSAFHAASCYASSCGRVTLYLGDSLAIAPTLQGVDAIISDPPYGMSWDTNFRFSGGVNKRKRGNGGREWGDGIINDDKPFDPSPWLSWEKVVLFGSNHFGARLPVGTKLVWIKRNDEAFGSFLSDAEEAWMKGGHGIYCKRDLSINAKNQNDPRLHPCEKPVSLMAWCMDKAKVPEGATVLDPYMGSGSTIIAAIRTGRRAIGIELDPAHYAIAVERIRREIEGDLFHSQHNVQEHATLSAGASVERGVEVEATKDHVNRAADRGCCVSSCSPLEFSSGGVSVQRLSRPKAGGESDQVFIVDVDDEFFGTVLLSMPDEIQRVIQDWYQAGHLDQVAAWLLLKGMDHHRAMEVLSSCNTLRSE